MNKEQQGHQPAKSDGGAALGEEGMEAGGK